MKCQGQILEFTGLYFCCSSRRRGKQYWLHLSPGIDLIRANSQKKMSLGLLLQQLSSIARGKPLPEGVEEDVYWLLLFSLLYSKVLNQDMQCMYYWSYRNLRDICNVMLECHAWIRPVSKNVLSWSRQHVISSL